MNVAVTQHQGRIPENSMAIKTTTVTGLVPAALSKNDRRNCFFEMNLETFSLPMVPWRLK